MDDYNRSMSILKTVQETKESSQTKQMVKVQSAENILKLTKELKSNKILKSIKDSRNSSAANSKLIKVASRTQKEKETENVDEISIKDQAQNTTPNIFSKLILVLDPPSMSKEEFQSTLYKTKEHITKSNVQLSSQKIKSSIKLNSPSITPIQDSREEMSIEEKAAEMNKAIIDQISRDIPTPEVNVQTDCTFSKRPLSKTYSSYMRHRHRQKIQDLNESNIIQDTNTSKLSPLMKSTLKKSNWKKDFM